jgi:hypothetical protein
VTIIQEATRGLMELSFAWTTPAIVSRAKSVTRRNWKPRHARKFRAGQRVVATDRQRRNGGVAVAILTLRETPYQENIAEAPDHDYQREGFAWLYAHPEAIPKRYQLDDVSLEGWARWKATEQVLWVVRFDIERVFTEEERAPLLAAGRPLVVA